MNVIAGQEEGALLSGCGRRRLRERAWIAEAISTRSKYNHLSTTIKVAVLRESTQALSKRAVLNDGISGKEKGI